MKLWNGHPEYIRARTVVSNIMKKRGSRLRSSYTNPILSYITVYKGLGWESAIITPMLVYWNSARPKTTREKKKKKRPRGAGGKCRAPFFRCCRPVRSLDLKMRAPSHPYERGTESNGRVTRRKAIKKEREKTKKKRNAFGFPRYGRSWWHPAVS